MKLQGIKQFAPQYPFLPFLLIIVLTVACKGNSNKSVENTVHPSDTVCLRKIAEAKADFRRGKLVYCNYVENIIGQSLRAEKEMDSLLNRIGVIYEDESSPCVVQPNRNYRCYCELMRERIGEKFGKKLIDSLLYVADSLYILKHRDQVFDCGSKSSCWDIPVMFPGDSIPDRTNHSGLQGEFEKRVKYAADYRFRKGENSMATLHVYLDVDENGKAIVTDIQFLFWDNRTKEEDYNKKYWSYFENIAVPLIEETTWTPATIKSIGVKSKNDIFIYLR